MKKPILTLLAIMAIIMTSTSQECLDADYQLRAYCYAGSSVEDTSSLGGFYAAQNIPKKINTVIKQLSTPEKFQLYVDTDAHATFREKYRGFKLYVINRSGGNVSLPAQDSRLTLKRQVYHNKKWQDIEYIPSSWCGNSYHNVIIRDGEFWNLVVPCLTGTIEAEFRFEIALANGQLAYSNTFSGSFNLSQLRKKQGYKATNIMDSYDN